MTREQTRRDFMAKAGIGAAALPFLTNLTSFGATAARKRRLVVVFSPNGVVPKDFWPDKEGPHEGFKEILKPLEPFKDQVLTLKGISDRVKGDGDSHMRGIGCLLTGIELFPGNIQGGSDTPAGWSTGHSIDQEIKRHLQSNAETETRFGSLEFGVSVPDRADTWTRMVYAGPNRPIAPVSDPYQMFKRLYGQVKDRKAISSVLDHVLADLKKIESQVGSEDRRLLDQHASFVREMERELKAAAASEDNGHSIPKLDPNVELKNDNMPKISKMQIDLMVNSFTADFSRIATYQITNSVGQARMKWIGIDEGHHSLSHKPDKDEASQEKLRKINRWYCEQVAYLVDRLAKTPEPGGEGSLLDNTLVVWTNELGKGNSHTLHNIPFVLVGGGMDFKMGRAVDFKNVAHNRLLISLAHGMGHHIERFGNPDHCGDGPLTGLA
ncbi:hypothetical protein Pan216_33540 [Planctomycetes bacterium Pan216]|uniref:DUF1552 domain-containing protein n=1 Tax=Kolteria novifilia TaxID=2527975 RepID=A0A518B686_9BACT|nr:hypothetical protein Pan216_33540 [Planctomycetes bacterium Pan216]